ncbi:hypothetical protein HAX54_048822 [Datura stramonium]|uniref:Uncharacterized protein n=1 Tax=Datura stramonium TaxID=4076 RepID=A0ABS8SW33_DATST|nr:hypothetical protein [Datura stramonium]
MDYRSHRGNMQNSLWIERNVRIFEGNAQDSESLTRAIVRVSNQTAEGIAKLLLVGVDVLLDDDVAVVVPASNMQRRHVGVDDNEDEDGVDNDRGTKKGPLCRLTG